MPSVSYPQNPDTPTSHLPFSPCVVVGDMILVSGQASVDSTGKIVSDTFEGEFRRTLESTGLGYRLEINMLNVARELDMLTIGYAFKESDTKILITDAAPDIFIFHAGITRGGSTGYAGGSSLERMAKLSQANFEIAKKIKPDVILLAHGAALLDPADAQYILDHTACHGVQVGSSIERLAIEDPLRERSAAFKSLRFSGSGANRTNRTQS